MYSLIPLSYTLPNGGRGGVCIMVDHDDEMSTVTNVKMKLQFGKQFY